MGRRTKEELIQSNYYEWLTASNLLREKKKGGTKLTASEKMLLRTTPSPESPYVPQGAGETAAPVKKKKTIKAKIDFDKSVVWSVKANSFLCGVFNIPFTDEECMLFCERDDCPFNGIGYFRSHGIKF